MTGDRHTPGPWTIEPLQSTMGADMAIVAPGNGWVVAVVQHDPEIQTADPEYIDGDSVIWHPDDRANAALIAEAPAMLEALRAWAQGPAPSTRKLTQPYFDALAIIARIDGSAGA